MFLWYFIGTIVATFFAAVPDALGRKKTVWYFFTLSVLAQAILLYIPNYYAKSLAYLMLGLGRLKDSQCYVWLSECFPFRLKSTAFTIINIVDSLPLLVTCFYLFFIERDIYPINIWVFYVSCAALALSVICPESPRWLLING